MSNEKPLVNKSFAEAFEKAKKKKGKKEKPSIDFQGEIVEEK